MNDELLALGRRAIACKGWQWMPGMRAWAADEDQPMYARQISPVGYAYGSRIECDDTILGSFSDPEEDWVPDLSDPATLGCVDRLLENLHGAPVVVLPFGRTWRAWRVLPPDGHGNDYTLSAICNGVTPISARVFALEAAT